jgi:hypothetical protein
MYQTVGISPDQQPHHSGGGDWWPARAVDDE